MALTLESIQNMIEGGIYFSSDRETIEYLLGKDLEPLDEYILLVSEKWIRLYQTLDLSIPEIACIDYGEFLPEYNWDKKEAVCALLDGELKGKKIYIDEKSEPVCFITFLESNHNTIRFIGESLYEESLIKTEKQIAAIEGALALNDAAYRSVLRSLLDGVSEMEIFRTIKSVYNEKTSENIQFIADVIAGVRTAEVSGPPTEYRLSEGDAVILDLLPRYRGIYCDTTRTLFWGNPSKKQKEIYRILAEALEMGKEKLKPGVCAKDVYLTIHSCLKRHGYESYFPHHAGHGFGKTIYEAPYFLPGCKTELKENMAVTLEPGIYLPGQFGIRLENDFQITEKGARLLGAMPLGIETYIVQQ